MSINNLLTNYDVMISYSSKRTLIAEDIKEMLISNGISVWMAPNSITAGSDYKSEIFAAIENAKMMLFVLSEESLQSNWCKQELIYAVKTNKTFVPVQIADVDNPYAKLANINIVLERHHILSVYPEYQKKLDKVLEDVKLHLSGKVASYKPYPQNSYGYEESHSLFVGRNNVIDEIYSLLSNHHIVNLHGMGGLGKTTVIKMFFTKYLVSGGYQSIHIAKYTNSLKKTISSIPFVGFSDSEYLDSIRDNSILKEDALFEKKLMLMHECANKCLLIIDGIDYVSDSELEPLLNLSIPILLTSRCKYQNVFNYELTPMSKEELFNLFINYSKVDINDNEENAIYTILEEVGYHTLTVKLIASYCYDLGLLPSEVVSEGVIDDIGIYDNHEEKISTLIDKYRLKEDELYALRALSLFPNGISKGKFQKIERQTLRSYPQLVNKGLVIANDTSYQLHQIIREIIIKNYKVTTVNLKPFLSSFADVFRHVGFESNELNRIIKHIDNSLEGNDYLMAKVYHLFGNCLCDVGYANMFHISSETYESQDMNFANKINDTKMNYEYFLYSLSLNKKALEIALKLTDSEEKKIIPYIYSYLGSTNFNMNDFTTALKFQKKALETAMLYLEESHHDYLVILNRIGLTAIETKEFDEAISAFKEYERIGITHNLDVNFSMISFEIGNVYLKMNDLEKAKQYYFKSISEIKDDLETSYGYSELCLSLASIYKQENNSTEASKYYMIAKDIRKRILTDDEEFIKFEHKYDKLYL